MSMSIDEYFDAEGVVPVAFEEVERFCTTTFGEGYKEERERALSSLEYSAKANVLKFYSHLVKYDSMGFIIGLNYEQNKHNMPLILFTTIPYERIIDLGCSDSFKTLFYALNYPDKKFVAVDMHPESLELAERRIKRYGVKNIELICRDLYNLKELNRSFDSVLAVNMLHECMIPDVSGYSSQMYMDFFNKIKAINSILELSGRLVVSLNYYDDNNEAEVFNLELNPAAEHHALDLFSRKCRYFSKGGEREYNGLYVYSKPAL